MAKPKSPLLSLGAKGTIADTLTFQKRGRDTIARTKPIPRDPYSLNQAYQRWDYRDYAYRWTLLSNAEKQVYRTKASRYHITGFSQWMRENLKTLPDIAGRWHMDEKSGAVAHDSSKHNNNGIIIGATPVSGLIAGSYYFDGLNDYIHIPTFNTQGEFDLGGFTIELYFHLAQLGVIQGLVDIFVGAAHSVYMRITALNKCQFGWSNSLGAFQWTIGVTPLLIDTWYFTAFTLEGSLATIYLNDSIDKQEAKVGTLLTGSDMVDIGRLAGANWLKGYQDELIIRNRPISITEAIRHSERRYPAQ